MDIFERYSSLDKNDIQNIDTFFEIFEEDSKNKAVLISKYFEFYQFVCKNEGHKRIKLFNDIAKRYYNNNPYYINLYELIFIRMTYAYSIGDFIRVFNLVNKFDKEHTPGDFLIEANCIQLNILTTLRMEKEAYKCIEELTKADFFINSNSYYKGVFYLNAIPLIVRSQNAVKTYEYFNLLEQALQDSNLAESDKELTIKIIKFYAEIYLAKYGLIEGDIKALSFAFYDFVMNENISTQTMSFDTNTFISILEILLEYCNDKMLFDICLKVINEARLVNRDLIEFYNFLYQTNNEYFIDNKEMEENHLRILNKYYNDNYRNNVQNLKDSLRLQLLEQRYSIMESKYILDVLTNCYSRNYLVELEGNRINNACVCYLDLDKLKLVNDTYGHTFGDEYLKTFSKILHNSFETLYHQVFRYGGDEFVVVIYNEDKDVVLERLDLLHQYCSTTKLSDIDLEEICYSCGVCFLDQEMLLKEAVVLADNAMYVCKKQREEDKTCKYVIHEN